jgi:hypothetical protein
MKIERFQAGARCASALIVLALVGCGGGAAREAQQLSRLSILESARPLPQNLLKPTEIDNTSDASGVRTLLRFWSTLQYGGYESATSYFDPLLVNSVGVVKLTVVLQHEAPLWAFTKPRVAVATTTGRVARVYFFIRDLEGKTGPVEIIFRRRGADWKISFLSLLQTAPPGYSAPLAR